MFDYKLACIGSVVLSIGGFILLLSKEPKKQDCPKAAIDMAEVTKIADKQIRLQKDCTKLAQCLGCKESYVKYEPFIFNCYIRDCDHSQFHNSFYFHVDETQIVMTLMYCELGAKNAKHNK